MNSLTSNYLLKKVIPLLLAAVLIFAGMPLTAWGSELSDSMSQQQGDLNNGDENDITDGDNLTDGDENDITDGDNLTDGDENDITDGDNLTDGDETDVITNLGTGIMMMRAAQPITIDSVTALMQSGLTKFKLPLDSPSSFGWTTGALDMLEQAFRSVLAGYSDEELAAVSSLIETAITSGKGVDFVAAVNGVTSQYSEAAFETTSDFYSAGVYIDGNGKQYYTYCGESHAISPIKGNKYFRISSAGFTAYQAELARALQAGYPYDSFGLSGVSASAKSSSAMGAYTQQVIWDLLEGASAPTFPDPYSIALFNYAKNGGELSFINKALVQNSEQVVMNYVPLPETEAPAEGEATNEGETPAAVSPYAGKYAGEITLTANKAVSVTVDFPAVCQLFDASGKEIKNGGSLYLLAGDTTLTMVSADKVALEDMFLSYDYISYEIVDQSTIALFQTVDLAYNSRNNQLDKPYQKMVGYETIVYEADGELTAFSFVHPDDPTLDSDEEDEENDNTPVKPNRPNRPSGGSSNNNNNNSSNNNNNNSNNNTENDSNENDTGEVVIDNEPTPGGAAPTDDNNSPSQSQPAVVKPQSSDETIIIDGDTPLGELPVTGLEASAAHSTPLLTALFALLGILGVGMIGKGRKAK